MFDAFKMFKVPKSKLPDSDESDELFTPGIEEPTVQQILDTDGRAYIEWQTSINRLKKGGKSRKNKRGTRRHRKTRR